MITFDSLVLNKQQYKVLPISGTIISGDSRNFIIVDTDSIKIRINFLFKSNSNRPKNHKIRVDIYENGKWYKPNLYIDLHNFHRFRIRRAQCWGRTSLSYDGGYPYSRNCSCWKPLIGKEKHQFYMVSKFVIN